MKNLMKSSYDRIWTSAITKKYLEVLRDVKIRNRLQIETINKKVPTADKTCHQLTKLGYQDI